ncbi:MAG: glycerate kinase [Chloroflexi bacterium]|nr:MAG: glycerate kinase [Chloroflexota bacterium]
MRILVCAQEFKGSLTAMQATRAIATGLHRASPDAEVIEQPMADGGPGLVAIVCATVGAPTIERSATGPLGAPMDARFGLVDRVGSTPLAVIEAAATVGLTLVPVGARDPANATSTGVGEQLRQALLAGAREIIVGVGGTATNDGGAGLAQALGCVLLDDHGTPLPPGPRHLDRLDRIDAAGVETMLRGVRLRIAVDVTNRLLGAEGATAVYGPQKGVTPETAPMLERALKQWARVVARDLGVPIAELDGGGAGGGIAAGLVAIGRAAGADVTIESGAALVAEAVHLAEAIAQADLVVTGEGRLDTQTAFGKTVAHIAALAAAAGRPCIVVAGSIEAVPATVADAEASSPPGMPTEQAMRAGEELVSAAAARLMTRWLREH